MDEPHRRLQESERLLVRKEALAQVARPALEDAAHLYRAIFESRAVIKVLIDPDDRQIIDANQAAAEFYGAPREVLRQCYAWQISTMSREALLALFADFKSRPGNLAQEYQTRHRRADGEFYEVGIHIDLIYRENRCFILATVLDLTERQRAEAAIQASLALQREWLEAIPTPVFYKQNFRFTSFPRRRESSNLLKSLDNRFRGYDEFTSLAKVLIRMRKGAIRASTAPSLNFSGHPKLN